MVAVAPKLAETLPDIFFAPLLSGAVKSFRLHTPPVSSVWWERYADEEAGAVVKKTKPFTSEHK